MLLVVGIISFGINALIGSFFVSLSFAMSAWYALALQPPEARWITATLWVLFAFFIALAIAVLIEYRYPHSLLPRSMLKSSPSSGS